MALKEGIGGKGSFFRSRSLSLSLGKSPSALITSHKTQHLKAGDCGIEARGLWEYS